MNNSMKYRLGTPCLILVLCIVSSAAFGADRITIHGVDEPLEENIRQHLTLSERDCKAPQWRLQAARDDAAVEITQALQALGYYDATIKSGELQHGEECWSISFDITPGKPVRIQRIDIDFEQDAARDNHFNKLRDKLPVVKGEILNHGKYTETKDAIHTLALERGYFDAELSRHQLLVDPEQRSADIALTMVSGSRYRFGDVNINSDFFDQDLLDRLVTITPGDLYTIEEVFEFQQALNDSGYFEAAIIQERHDKQQQLVHLDVTLTQNKRYAIGFGVGVTTDGGPRISSNLQDRYVNSHGHRFKSNIRYEALLGATLDLIYSIPLENPTREWFSFLGQIETFETDTSERNTTRLGMRMNKIRPHEWLETRYLTLKYEEYEVAKKVGRAMPLIPGIIWSRTRKDSQHLILNGDKLHLELRAAVHDFSEGSPFFQAIASGKWINSPWETGRIISRLDLGLTVVDDINNIAASDRFFAGGDNSIRGYGFQDLGPLNEHGYVTGGKYLAVASLEYEHFLKSGWSVAAFVDSGSAFDDDSMDVQTGIGLGVRWLSPLGPIKVDLAHPLDDDSKDIRFIFRMGPEF